MVVHTDDSGVLAICIRKALARWSADYNIDRPKWIQQLRIVNGSHIRVQPRIFMVSQVCFPGVRIILCCSYNRKSTSLRETKAKTTCARKQVYNFVVIDNNLPPSSRYILYRWLVVCNMLLEIAKLSSSFLMVDTIPNILFHNELMIQQYHEKVRLGKYL